MRNLRVACVSAPFPFDDIVGNLTRIHDHACFAKEAKADLVCFPELSLTGYNLSPEVLKIAEPIPGPSIDKLCKVSQRLQIALLVGCPEKTSKGVHIAHVAIEEGKIIGVYRKVHLSPGEQARFIPGNTIAPMRLKNITAGIGLCLDAHIPEFSSSLALQGAEVLIFPHASPPKETPEQKRERWLRYLPARAYDNSVYLMACNLSGDRPNGSSFTPASLILDPKGCILGERFGQEGMIFSDLSAIRLTEVRSNPMGFFLNVRRPEAYWPHLSHDSKDSAKKMGRG